MSAIIGGLMSGAAGIGAQLLQNSANKKMAEYAYSKDLEMWNRQNAYNDPKAQMSRLDSAGLNPNMMYGTGQSANMAKEMPKYNAPTMKYDNILPAVAGAMSQFQDTKVKQAQTDNIKAQTEGVLLKNNLMGSTIMEQIDAIKNTSYSIQVKAQLDNIKRMVETAIWGENWTPPETSGQFKQRSSEIVKTQADAHRASSDAELKQTEAEMYRILKTVGAGSQVGQVVNNFMRMFLQRKK